MHRALLNKNGYSLKKTLEISNSNAYQHKKILIIPKTNNKSLPSFPKVPKTSNSVILMTPKVKSAERSMDSDDEIEEESRINKFINLTDRLMKRKVILPIISGLKSNTRMPKIKAPQTTQQYVNDFIFSESKDQYARVIQEAFRNYRNKLHWKKFINLRIKYHRRLESLVLTNWKLYLAKDVNKMREYRKKLMKVSKDLLFVQREREFSSFSYFYVSGAFFVPRGYTQQTLFDFIWIMFSMRNRQIFRMWHMIARSRKCNREKCIQFQFTMKKQRIFGVVFEAFNNWNRYTKWVKLAKKQPKNSSNFITINNKELSIQWKVKEIFLNQKIKRIKRANEQQRRSVITKAIKALFNRSLQVIANQTIIKNSDDFRNIALMKRAHRGWTKFIEIKQHRKQIIHDSIRSWYDIAYNKAKKKQIVEFYKERESKFFLQKILNKWIRLKDIRKTNSIKMGMNIQKNSSCFLQMFYLMNDKKDFAIHIMCFRMWIKYTRARHRWHEFSHWVQTENRETEFKQQVMGELIHFAAGRIVGRINSIDSIIPRKLGICFERTLSEYNKEIFDLEKEVNMTKEGNLDVRRLEIKKEINYRHPKDLLLRVFLLKLNHVKKFERYGRVYEPVEPARAPKHSKEEIVSCVERNRKIFKNNLEYKALNDNPIIYSMISHSKAKSMNEYFNDFKTLEEPIIILPPKLIIDLDYTPIVFINDTNVAIDQELVKIKNSPNKIKITFSEEYEMAARLFDQRLRSPEDIGMKVNNSLGSSITKITSINDSLILKSQLYTNSKIESYNMLTLKDERNSKILSSSSIFNIAKVAIDFTFSNIYDAVGELISQHEMISSINKFFSIYSKTPFKSMTPINELSPVLFKGDASPLMKRRVKKNVEKYINSILNTKRKTKISDKLSTFARSIVNAIFTANVSLRGTKVENYCNEVPFLKQVTLDKDEDVIVRHRIWNSIKRKYPKIEGKASVGLSSINMFTIGDNLFEMETITSKDAYIICLVLPHVLEEESIADFIRDFILDEQINTTVW